MGDNGSTNGRRKLFDPTITLGAVIQIIVLIGTIAVGWATLESRITTLENQAAQRERDLQGISDRLDILDDKLNGVVVEQGVTTTKLDDLIKRVDSQR